MSQPSQIHVLLPAGQQTLHLEPAAFKQRLTDLFRRSGIALNTRCGQRGLCDSCTVELVEGQVLHNPSKERLAGEQPGRTIRACECSPVAGEAKVLVPARSMLAYEPQVVSSFKINVPHAHDPLWQCLKVSRAELGEGEIRGARLAAYVAGHLDLHEPPTVPEEVAAGLRDCKADPLYVTAEYRATRWIISEVSCSAPPAPLGLAIDIGTTTVAALLVDLSNGKVVGSASSFNRQIHLGDDVLTRINLCTNDHAMIGRLQHAVVNDTLQRLLLKSLEAAGASDAQLACGVVAANTTMLHLLAGVDPSSMGVAPFTPNFVDYRAVSASAIHFHASGPRESDGGDEPQPVASEDPVFHLLPSASAYVGADLTAGILASGMAYDDGPSLLVDVGTNGEIIFKHGQTVLGCATAAGPAFEGSRLVCGMRAGAGAISHIRITRDPFTVEYDVIGDAKPTGLCGSAYVDFLAQARRAGLISATGRFESGVADDRIMDHASSKSRGFRVAFAHGKEPLLVTEGDIASLLQAKAAIAAGILTLLNRAGVRPEQIKTLYLAGGFGMHMNIDDAIGCGLLPGFTRQQVQLVGNSSLAGAYMALLDSSVMDELTRIARGVQIVELNLEPGFEGCYVDQLWLPE